MSGPGAPSPGMSLFVKGLEIEASIGVHHHERGATQPVLIDVELGIDPPQMDSLSATVDYDAVVEAIRAIVGQGHIELVEQLAQQIARAILAIGGVRSVGIEIAKPRAIASARCAGVRLTALRDEPA